MVEVTNIRLRSHWPDGEMSPVLKERTSPERSWGGHDGTDHSLCFIRRLRTSAVAAESVCLVYLCRTQPLKPTNLPTGSERLHIVEQILETF